MFAGLLDRPPAHKATKEPLFAEGSEDHVIIKHTFFSFSFVCLCFSYRVKRLAYRGYFWYQTLLDLITFECVDGISRCERSNESYCEVLFCEQYLQVIPEVVLQCFVRSISAALSGPGLSFREERELVSPAIEPSYFRDFFSSFISTLRQRKEINVLTKTDSQRLAGKLFVS